MEFLRHLFRPIKTRLVEALQDVEALPQSARNGVCFTFFVFRRTYYIKVWSASVEPHQPQGKQGSTLKAHVGLEKPLRKEMTVKDTTEASAVSLRKSPCLIPYCLLSSLEPPPR